MTKQLQPAIIKLRDEAVQKLREKSMQNLRKKMEKEGLPFDEDSIVGENYCGPINQAISMKQTMIVLIAVFIFCFCPLLLAKLFDVFFACFVIFMLYPIMVYGKYMSLGYLIWMENRVFIQPYIGRCKLISLDQIYKIYYDRVTLEFVMYYGKRWAKHGIPGYAVLRYLEFMNENRPDLEIHQNIINDEAVIASIKKSLNKNYGNNVTRY